MKMSPEAAYESWELMGEFKEEFRGEFMDWTSSRPTMKMSPEAACVGIHKRIYRGVEGLDVVDAKISPFGLMASLRTCVS